MKRQIIKIAVGGLLLFGVTKLSAQNTHEFSIFGGSGSSVLAYKVAAGEHANGFGGQFGFGYHYSFSPILDFGTGMEFSLYSASFNLDNLNTRYMAVDPSGDVFDFRSLIRNYKERQRSMMLQIPLMAQYRMGDERQFFAAAGLKIGIPLTGTYRNSYEKIENKGYYEYEDMEYDTQQFVGFGTFADRDAKGALKFKAALLLSLETGMKWKLSNVFSLYPSIYMDYGLAGTFVRAQNAAPLHFIEYNSNAPRDFAVNSIVKSKYAQGETFQSFTNKVTPIAIGIKLRLSLEQDRNETKKALRRIFKPREKASS